MVCSFRCLLLAILTLYGAFVARAEASDWLRFRGPNGKGLSTDGQLGPVSWSETENVKWKVELPGPGSSSPIVVGDKVFVTCWSGYGLDREEPGDQSQLKRHLICCDRQSGKILWDQSVAAYLPEDRYGGMFAEHGYASHSPVSDGERVYAFFGKTGAVAFDMDGRQVWQQRVGTESGMNNWGSASSPILYENLLIVTATAESEALVALDKATGKEVWRQEAAGFSGVWGTPVLVPVDERRTDLVIAVPGEIWGFDPADGNLIWYCRTMPNSSFCSSVIAHEGVIYAIESGPGGGGGIAVRAGGLGDVTESQVIWSGRQQNRIATPVIHDGRIYTFGGGIATCLDAETGEQVYRARLRSTREAGARGSGGRGRGQDYASPILAAGMIYYTSRSGDVFVIQAADEFLQLGVNRVTSESEDFSATPAICDGQLFLRSSKRLYCIENASGTGGDLEQALAAAREAAKSAPAEASVADGETRPGGRRGGGFDPEAYFRRQDIDGDGKLTGDEISGRLRDALDQVDGDGDGAVTQEEYLAGMRRIFRRQGAARGRGESGPAKPQRPQRPPLAD